MSTPTIQPGDIIRTVETRQIGLVVAVFAPESLNAGQLVVWFLDAFSPALQGDGVWGSACSDDAGWYSPDDVRRIGTIGPLNRNQIQAVLDWSAGHNVFIDRVTREAMEHQILEAV